MAEGVKNTVKMLANRSDIFTLNCYDKSDDIESEIDDLLKKLEHGEKTLIFTDLLGGSVNQVITRRFLLNDSFIVTGFNLALILECLFLDDETLTKSKLNEIIEKARTEMVLVNDLLKKEENKDD